MLFKPSCLENRETWGTRNYGGCFGYNEPSPSLT
jgi:hypothetical protein